MNKYIIVPYQSCQALTIVSNQFIKQLCINDDIFSAITERLINVKNSTYRPWGIKIINSSGESFFTSVTANLFDLKYCLDNFLKNVNNDINKITLYSDLTILNHNNINAFK